MIAHHFGGGVYVKEAAFPAGSVLVQHRHTFEHLSYLVSGTVQVEVDGRRQHFTGPACLTIESHKHHGVKALTDCVWLCIHATDCTDADDVDQVLIEPASVDMDAMAERMAREAN